MYFFLSYKNFIDASMVDSTYEGEYRSTHKGHLKQNLGASQLDHKFGLFLTARPTKREVLGKRAKLSKHI